MVSHHLEIERKYEMADVLAAVPQMKWSFKKLVAASPVKEHLDATYFDTAAGDLGRHKIALRRRLGGYDQGWHIKFDADGSRHEVGFALLEDSSEMPVPVARFVRSATLNAKLLPQVALVTDRVRTVLSLPGLGDVAEICEDSVQSTDHITGIERAWCEWEVELLGRAENDTELARTVFKEVEKVLFAAGAVASHSTAKIARALGKDAGFEARRNAAEGAEKKAKKKAKSQKKKKSRVAPLPRIPGSAQLLTEILGGQTLALVQVDLLLKAGVPDATHLGRIAARQLRSTLKYMARPYAKSDEAGAELAHLEDELRFYASVLEQNRDGELISETLAGSEPNDTVGTKFMKKLASLAKEEQQEGRQKALDYLDSQRRLSLQEALGEVLGDVTVVADLPLNSENYLNKVAKRLRKGLLKTSGVVAEQGSFVPEGEEGSDERLHDLRKMAKAVRYVLAACQDAGLPLTEDQLELMGVARDLQSKLGQLTDELTFSHWISQSRGRLTLSEGRAISLGYLLGSSETRALTLRQTLTEDLPVALKKVKKLELH